MANPKTIELILKILFDERLKKMMANKTNAANPKFINDPKVPLASAAAPPPQALIPALMRDIPMSVTTIPETSGVIIF